MKIILASQSPRRSAIMDLAGIEYEALPSNFEEILNPEETLEEQSKRLAFGKAKDVFERTQGDRTIIGADTIVVKDNKIFGKPGNKEEARKMLRTLQGNIHTVYTGIAIIIENQGKREIIKEVIKTDIMIHDMTEEEIEEFLETEKPFDKAGAYAVQSSFCKYIDEIEGNYMSVIGLPISRIYQILREKHII